MIQPESCATCHPNQGDAHQAFYDQLYQDGVITVTNVAYQFAGGSSVVSFTMKMNGVAIDGNSVDSLGIYWVEWTGTDFEMPNGRLSIKGTMSYANGVTTSTLANSTNLNATDGLIVIYGRDGTIDTIPNSRVNQEKYPFAALLETGNGVSYTSAANNAGCEKCHTTPYLKHGYIYAEVNHDPSTDFLVCKACHLDNGDGEHILWQMLLDDPAAAAANEAGTPPTAAQEAKYAYKTSVMNDVHMSHRAEFPYPQSMANCVTCHADKLDMILTDDNFRIEVCKSCHPVDGSAQYGTDTFALKTLLPAIHDSMDLDTVDCAGCHKSGGIAPTFKQIHSGYDTAIYTADGQRYPDGIKTTINSATFTGNKLTVSASATGVVGTADAKNIVPEFMVSMYGYDTKDFIVNGHDRYDSNGDGTVDRNDNAIGAYVIGTTHKYWTTVTNNPGSWSATFDMSDWASMIQSGAVKRVEVAVLSALDNADKVEVAVNAVSRTFDLNANAFADGYYPAIVKVEDGCNNCHDQLATTFHSPDYGGDITVCQMCHVSLVGASHLEMQSRSIDSYVHAIHSMQYFDVASVDFSDPVQATEYMLHTEMPYPTHGIRDCESCHVAGMYNVPDQSMTLPGVLSASATLKGKDTTIVEPSVVVGPAARACGACHRSQMINEDASGELAAFYSHFTVNGYAVPDGTNGMTTSQIMTDAINTIMSIFGN